jgi:hypothetical protein
MHIVWTKIARKGKYPNPKASVAKGKGYIQRKGKGKAKANPPKPKDMKLMVTSKTCFEYGEVGHLRGIVQTTSKS